jgi:RNA polymerase sigma-70 factor (ECF subfamily)
VPLQTQLTQFIFTWRERRSPRSQVGSRITLSSRHSRRHCADFLTREIILGFEPKRYHSGLEKWMATKETTEHESWLVLHAQAGDREAFDALLKGLQSPLFRYISSLVRNEASAEDVLQEVFLRIYRSLRWLSEPNLLRPWAYRIATNEALRHMKRHRRWDEHVHDDDVLAALRAPPPDDTVVTGRLADLPSLVATLSPASRAVIVLHYLHELSLEDVAAALDIPLGTVKSRLAYGLYRLRKQTQG